MGVVTDPNTLARLNGGRVAAPQGGTVQLPRLPNRVKKEGVDILGGELNNTGQGLSNAKNAGTLNADINNAISNATKAGIDAALAGQNLSRGGVSQEKYDKDLGRYNTAQQLLRSLGQIENKFSQDFRGGGILQSAREFLPNRVSPKNQEFDNAANGMKPLLYALLPKTDSNPAATQLVPFDQYVPQSGNFDNTNADAIKRTRQLALGVLAETGYTQKLNNDGFQKAVKLLASNPSPVARKQYDEAAKRFGWPKSSAQILGGK